MEAPHYTYPLRLLPGMLVSLLFGRGRSFRRDSIAFMSCLKPPLQVFGRENIPTSGPCVLVVNHYYRPGFGAWWIAFAVTSCLPLEPHWVMTAELTFSGRWYGFLGRPLSRWFLCRVGRLYGFTPMPPMPPRPHEVQARARAVRLVLRHVQHEPRAVLALAPEGGDHPDGVLSQPPPGAGRFLLLLAEAGFSILPVGCWEQDGRLCLRFGSSFHLQVSPTLRAEARDLLAVRQVMNAIACQIPTSLRGEYPIQLE